MRKSKVNEAQLSLFEPFENRSQSTEETQPEPTTFYEFARKRFEDNPNMKPEEYKRWIKFLINVSLKSIDK